MNELTESRLLLKTLVDEKNIREGEEPADSVCEEIPNQSGVQRQTLAQDNYDD